MSLLHFPAPTSNPDVLEAEIERLLNLANVIPRKIQAGDDNLAALTAQIEVIANRMSKNSVIADFEGDGQYVLRAALSAADWIEGETAPPSESWKTMVND